MTTPNRANYYTYKKIPGQKISQSGMDALVRMCNERFEDLSTRLYGNLQLKDLHKNAQGIINGKVNDADFQTSVTQTSERIALLATKQEVSDSLDDFADELAALADTTDGKTTTFFQDTEPTAAVINDVWYELDTDKIWKKIADGTGSDKWMDITASALKAALQAAADAQAVADGKIVSYYQNDTPTGEDHAVGDLWFDTNDKNKLYRWNGASWTSAQDGAIAEHADAIAELGAKTTIFYQESQPVSAADGDMWYDTDAVPVKIYRRTDSQWTDITTSALAAALKAAADAQAVADGKIRTFAQISAPTGMVASDVGDLWVDIDDENKIYRWSGTAWVNMQDTHLDTTVTTHTAQITTLNTGIALKADKTTVDTLGNTVSSLSATLDLVPGQITAEVTNKTIYVGATAPENPTLGKQWLNTSATPEELLYYNASGEWALVSSESKSVHVSSEMVFNENGLRIDTTLVNGATSVGLYFLANDEQIGLFRESDNKQLWGGKLLASGQVVTVTSALIDPDGDGSSVFLVQTSDGKTLLTLDMDSYEGATEEENPVPVGRLAGLQFGSKNAYTWQISDYADDFYSYIVGRGLFDIYAVDGQLILRGDNGVVFGYIAGDYTPDTTNAYNMGDASHGLKKYFGASTSIQSTSDERAKHDMRPLDPETMSRFIMALDATWYRLNDLPEDLMAGFRAQQFREAMRKAGIPDDFAGFNGKDPDHLCLDYGQVIAPLVSLIQRQEKRIKALEEKLGGTA